MHAKGRLPVPSPREPLEARVVSALLTRGMSVRLAMLVISGALAGSSLSDHFSGSGLDRLASVCAGALAGIFAHGWLIAACKVAADFVDRVLPSLGDMRLAHEVAAQVRRGNLHRIIGDEVVAQLFISDRHMAVLRAFRSVEIRLRDLVAPDTGLGGAALIEKAFSPDDGIFADWSRPRNEREATMHLFKSGFTLYRNLSVHHDFGQTRVETLGRIWHASELHQILDKAEQRRARQLTPS